MPENVEGDGDWRDKCVRKRLGFALTNDTTFKDVVFLVGKSEDEISAHKLILRLSSLVFENLISSREEQGLSVIRLPNASPVMFRRLLKFVYTDELEMDEIVQFFRVAKDFGFPKLAEQSISVLKKIGVTSENVFLILEIGREMSDTELEGSALTFIRRNAKAIMESKEIVKISYNSLCQILLDDGLFADEKTVFRAVLRWASFKCTESNIPISGDVIRGILKDARLYVRYSLMNYNDLITEVKDSGLLLPSEHLQVLKTFIDTSDNPLNLCTTPRDFEGYLQHQSTVDEYTVEYEYENDEQGEDPLHNEITILTVPTDSDSSAADVNQVPGVQTTSDPNARSTNLFSLSPSNMSQEVVETSSRSTLFETEAASSSSQPNSVFYQPSLLGLPPLIKPPQQNLIKKVTFRSNKSHPDPNLLDNAPGTASQTGVVRSPPISSKTVITNAQVVTFSSKGLANTDFRNDNEDSSSRAGTKRPEVGSSSTFVKSKRTDIKSGSASGSSFRIPVWPPCPLMSINIRPSHPAILKKPLLINPTITNFGPYPCPRYNDLEDFLCHTDSTISGDAASASARREVDLVTTGSGPSGVAKSSATLSPTSNVTTSTKLSPQKRPAVLTKPAAETSSEQQKRTQQESEHLQKEVEPLEPAFKKSKSSNDEDDTSFHLQNCSIDFRDVLNATQVQCSIQKMSFHNVIFQNALATQGRRVFLPNLKSFHFFQDEDTTTKLPDKNFSNGLTTKEFLFFEIDKLVPWTFSSLWSLGIEICLDVKGLRLIEINPNKKKLTLAYPVEEEVDLILESLFKQEDLKSLCLSACNIKSTFDLPTKHLETLVVQGVTFQDGKAMSYINKCRKLKKLSVFVKTGVRINLFSDLKMSRLTLEQLTLANADIGRWSKKLSLLSFPRLEELYLDVCKWAPCFVEHFSQMFPHLKRLAIRSKDSCRPTSRLLKEILEIKSLEKIAFFGYSGGEDTQENPNLNIFTPPLTWRKKYLIKFLVTAGMTFSGGKVPEFILEKDLTSEEWKVGQNSGNVFDEIHFQYSMLNEFFTNSAVAMSILIE